MTGGQRQEKKKLFSLGILKKLKVIAGNTICLRKHLKAFKRHLKALILIWWLIILKMILKLKFREAVNRYRH